MIEETAVVTRISQGQVWIKSQQTSACGGCMQQSSCTTASLSKLLPKREFAVECEQTLQVGDQVRVAIDDTHVLLSSLVLYLLPILVMLAAVVMADYWLPAYLVSEWLPEMALLTLLLTFWLIHRLQSPLLLYFCFRPQIVSKINAPVSLELMGTN